MSRGNSELMEKCLLDNDCNIKERETFVEIIKLIKEHKSDLSEKELGDEVCKKIEVLVPGGSDEI